MIREWVLKLLLHVVWRHRRGLYYAITAFSLAGNIVVLAGPPSLPVPSASASNFVSLALIEVKRVLPHVLEVVLHRSVIFILVNLIVFRIVVKSGSPCMTIEDNKRSQYIGAVDQRSQYIGAVDYKSRRAMSTSMTLYVSSVQKQASCGALFAGLAHETASQPRHHPMSHCIPHDKTHTLNEPQQRPNKEPNAEQTHVVQLRDRSEVCSQTNIQDKLEVSSQTNIQDKLERTMFCATAELQLKHAIPANNGDHHRAVDHDLSQLVPTTARDGDGDHAVTTGKKVQDSPDKELSAHEFNERVNDFICKFKRQLSMQRQDSLDRLLGLVGSVP